MHGGYYYYGTGTSLGLILANILFLAIGILKLILVIGLIIGVIQVIRDLFVANDNISLGSLLLNKWVVLSAKAFVVIVVLNLIISIYYGLRIF